MRFLIPTSLLLLAAQYASAETEPPACGFLCIYESTLASTCAQTNTTCICTNQELNAEIELCVMANCTVREQLTTQRYSQEICGVQSEDRRSLVWIVGVIFGIFGLMAFGARCFARLCLGAGSWGADDWLMCLAMHGLGLDMWIVAFDDITSILYLYYFDEILYVSSLSLTKISILLFYLKVFPKRPFRYATFALIALNLGYCLAFDLALVFQCWPIQGAWLQWDGQYEAHYCTSINVLGWSAAACNIALDLATIILPLPELCQLSMSLKRKSQIVLMFAVGFFVTIVSCLRLRSLIEFGKTKNITQDYVEVGYWSTIEVPVGVICACLPAIRSLFIVAFPQASWTDRRGKSSYGFSGPSGASKLSARPTLGSKQIAVKTELTVRSTLREDNASDEVELVLQSVRDSPRRMTLGRHQDGWAAQDLPIQEV